LCSSVHAPANPPVASQPSQPPPPSRPSTPAANGSGGTGTSTPTSAKDGNLYLECLNCSRQIASNRYEPHLSSCMGLATTRRGAARGTATAVKSKQPSEAEGRSTSPEADFSDDGKGKAKSKSKRPDAAEFSLKRKRPDSPQLTPSKKQKKRPVSGSPVNRLKADSDISSVVGNALKSPSTSSTSKVPSKLRDSSTASIVERSVTPSSRGYSSPADSPGASSSYSILQSPSLNGSPVKSIRSQVPVIVPPKPSPPRPIVDDYLLDDGGDATGSSTDTDSS